MDFRSMAMSESTHNVAAIRRMAKEKDFSIRKIRNQELYELRDLQTGAVVINGAPLWEIYEYLCDPER